jgi:cell wall-associated NlpC family hydrolase
MEWADLLKVPFADGGSDPTSGIDCSGTVLIVLKRLGVDITRAAFREDAGEHFEDWKLLGHRVDDAVELGDVILSDPDGCGFGCHVSVLVNVHNRTTLTAHKDRGVIAMPANRIRNVVGAFRYEQGGLS